MLKRGASKQIPMLVLALAVAVVTFGMQSDPPHGQWGQRGQDGQWGQRGQGKRDPEREKQERVDFLAKMLSWQMKAPDLSPEHAFLHARASELLERTKLARGNSFQFDRLARAMDALLRAGESIVRARKASQIDENERREAALFLQKCYFRLQQAEYFSGLSGEKEAKQYVTCTRSLYQQARSAYDARQYDRAQMLGDASSQLVTALENIAQASLSIPDPPVIK